LNPLLLTRAFDVGFPWARPDCESATSLDQSSLFRCQRFFFSEPLYEVITGLFVHNDSRISALRREEVAGRTLCRATGYPNHELDKGGRNWLKDGIVTLIRAPSVDECFRLLDRGTVDAVVESELAGRASITSLGLGEKVRMLDEPLALTTYHILIPKTHPHARTILYYVNSSLEKLRANGEYDRIIERHLARFWESQSVPSAGSGATPAAKFKAVPGAQPSPAPVEPTRIVFPFAAGGSGDALARLLAEHLRVTLSSPVIVENRTGAQGRLGVQAVKGAAPDGKTLLLTPIAPMSVYQHVYKSLPYDPIADFQPLSQVATFDFAIAVGPQVPATALTELVGWVKANPAQDTYGIPAAGTLPHFFGVLFARTAGLDLRHVSYRGSAAALTDLVAGQIPIVVTTTSDLLEQHKAGRIRVLATSDRQRSPFLPDIPTFKEAGFSIEGTGWYGLFAPAKTPPATVERLSKAIVAAVNVPQVKERLLAFGLVPTGTTPAELSRIQKADSELWSPAVEASGFTPEQ
jgi:tripartite-type tricarboxylate transporter receptor subunit TctC